MANYNYCKECKDFHYDNEPHIPEYFVRYEDYTGDDWTKVNSHSHYDAALKFAEDYNVNCDYVLMNDAIEVEVKDSKGVIEKYKVSAEASVDYSATEIT